MRRTIIYDSDIDNMFESIYCLIVTKIQKYKAKGLGKIIIDSVAEQNINISKHKPRSSNSYIRL